MPPELKLAMTLRWLRGGQYSTSTSSTSTAVARSAVRCGRPRAEWGGSAPGVHFWDACWRVREALCMRR